MTNNDNKFDRARKLIAEIAASKNPMALPALPEIYNEAYVYYYHDAGYTIRQLAEFYSVSTGKICYHIQKYRRNLASVDWEMFGHG